VRFLTSLYLKQKDTTPPRPLDRRAGQTSDLDKREVLDVIDVDVIEVY
jgi:hypothetical protein